MPKEIVIVEDNPADSKTMCFAIASHDSDVETTVLDNGAKALEFFSNAVKRGQHHPCDLVLLDLNLPLVSGFDVLEYLKTDPILKKIPVLVLSGSSSLQDIGRCYELGANSFVAKPFDLESFLSTIQSIEDYWLGTSAAAN